VGEHRRQRRRKRKWSDFNEDFEDFLDNLCAWTYYDDEEDYILPSVMYH
jgi:hypothetical protein